MRFKTSNLRDAKHRKLVSCVGWATPDEVLSAADDQKVLRWNLVTGETIQAAELPPDFHPTDMHWFPRGGGQPGDTRRAVGAAGPGGPHDLFLLTSSEGKLQLVNGKTGRLERSVDAHRGACLGGRWSPNGASIVTGGEDGVVKVWSRSVMLRSTLAVHSEPIYAVAWSSDSASVLYATGKAAPGDPAGSACLRPLLDRSILPEKGPP